MTYEYKDFDVHAFQRGVIAEFRENDGKLSGMFEGWSLILLTTTGARTGIRRTSLLGHLEIDGKTVVVASAMGAPTNPAWFHNIRKNPIVTVETGTETYEAIAAIPPGAERDALFADVVEQNPGFADYQAKTSRVIPVVVLHRLDRAAGMGDFLVKVHDWLRTELAELRRRVDDTDLLAQLREHCATFCGALTKHHTGEDIGTFPLLARQFPALAPALTRLGEEHVVVARLLEEIQQRVAEEHDPSRLRAEIDRLAAELEAHFAYEEQAIVTALNAIAPAPAMG